VLSQNQKYQNRKI